MKKILITGAGGFIGSHLARKIYKDGNFVRVVDIKWDGYLLEPYYSEKLTLDLRDYNNCLKVCDGIDEVYNLAANMGGIGYITAVHAEVARDNILINVNMAEACKIKKIKKILFSSSACVYNNDLQTEVNAKSLKESDAIPANPNEIYGWEKLFAEQVFEAYQEDCNLDIRLVRFHNVYGEEGTYKDGREKAPGALCRKIAQAKLTNQPSIIVWGDGLQERSFMHINDCCKGLIKLMNSDYQKPINLGRDRLIAIDDLAKIIMKIANYDCSILHDTTKPQGVRSRNSDNTLCKQVLKWTPQISLEEGLISTYNWIEERVKRDLNSENRRTS
ncbi:MAG: NAD-dependent epimerase/dehydratase family protein [Candidatus Helarchaeota archaeon]